MTNAAVGLISGGKKRRVVISRKFTKFHEAGVDDFLLWSILYA